MSSSAASSKDQHDPTSIQNTTSNSKSQSDAKNPFETPFDGDHDDGEWWNEEDEDTTDDDDKKNSTAAAARMTQWPTIPTPLEASTTQTPARTKSLKPAKRYSVYKPVREKSRQRQRKQNARAGIKVITSFPKNHGQAPVVRYPTIRQQRIPMQPPQAGGFVDLAALQALDSNAPQQGGFWKSLMGRNTTEPPPETEILQNNKENVDARGSVGGFGARRGNGLKPTSLNLQDDLSPNDRPIVIGISIPSAKLSQHITSPQTAVSETFNIIESYQARSPGDDVPETPLIMITPARESSWSPISFGTAATNEGGRIASSIYSRPEIYYSNPYQASKAPAMPQLPASILTSQSGKTNQRTSKSARDSFGTVFADDDEDIRTPQAKSRIMSSYTIFEEDQSPILSRKGRSGSDAAGKRMSALSTRSRRTSVGWWNHIVSPFASRSNTIRSQYGATEERPPLPSLDTSAVKAHNESRNIQRWEKELSPKTPFTSTTISSDAWWDNRNTVDGFPKSTEPETPIPEEGTLPFMLSPGGLGDVGMVGSNEQTLDQVQANRLRAGANAGNGTLQRGNSLVVPSNRASALSPSDREAPFMLGGSLHGSRPTLPATNPFAQNEVETTRYSSDSESRQPNTSTNPIIHVEQPTPRETPREAERRNSVHDPFPPPPYSPPRSDFPRYRAVYPPGHPSTLQPPPSPGPISPGLQNAMTSRGGIALTEVPLTPPARRVINLNSGYPRSLPERPSTAHVNPVDLQRASEKARKVEAKRRRHEKEDAIAHRAGGLWRGRGCISNSGCYGRKGAEGRKKRRCWCCVIIGITIFLIILASVLITQLHRPSGTPEPPSQWLNLTAFPPIYAGVSTVASPDNLVANTGCVYPKTAWSCALPKELQSSVAPDPPNQPNFRLFIQWDNSSAANATWQSGGKKRSALGNAISASQFVRSLLLKARQATAFTPVPVPPSLDEQVFLGNSTDGIVAKNKAGEATPFYITFLSTIEDSSQLSLLLARASNFTSQLPNSTLTDSSNSTNLFPNVTDFIPPPDLNADGTAAPANLLPFPIQQPIRLYDRGLPTEHYGFYTYYNRSIFLKSTALLDNSTAGEVPDDLNGGSTESAASVRCTWTQTRFLVQMWTRKSDTSSLLNATSLTDPFPTVNETAMNFVQPGSFPYPVTIAIDRHGGDPAKKLLYCYSMDKRERVVEDSGQVHLEFRGFGGSLINPAPSTFKNVSDPGLGGFDGGNGGCSCQWSNWHPRISA
jgi:hypothetical protein